MKKSKRYIEAKAQEQHKLQAEALLKNPTYQKAIKEYEDLDLFGKRCNDIAKEKEKIMNLIPKRLKAISPSSKYFKSFQRYKELDDIDSNLYLERTIKYNEICRKFHLPYPCSLSELKKIAEGGGFFFKRQNEIVDIIRLRETKYKPIPNEQLTKEDLAFCPHHSEIVDDGFLDEEGFLHFKIKAGEQRYIIHYLLDSLLSIHEPKGKKKRFRIGYINPYEVLYKESTEGKNLLQIAKEREGVNNLKGNDANPAYNQSVKSTYDQIKRASKTAKKLIS